VRRHNLVGDIGRRVGEAMAGYQSFYRDKLPEDEGLTGDRFVELCTGEYSRELARSVSGQQEADPNAEERKAMGDFADRLMSEWLQGSTQEMQLWEQMREWVLDSHRMTLARLGVAMDHQDFESEAIPRAIALIEEGLESGILEREKTGAVVYRTERSEYPTMVLIREDGFPTEHGRLFGVYDQILEDLAAGEPYIEVAGIEWQPSITVLCELLGRLRPGPRNETDIRVFHASVTSADGEKIGSSVGGVVWIDELLDVVAASPAVSDLGDLSEGTVSRDELADILVRGALLCTPAFRSFPFAQEALIEGGSGSGWTIAEAWCRAQLSKEPDEDFTPVARTAVIQSQLYRRSLRRAVEKRDVTCLARYLLNLSEAFLAAADPGPAAAPVMARVLNSLGFLAGDSSAGVLEGIDPVAAQRKVEA
jgi:arginyl-tRNA synthetase